MSPTIFRQDGFRFYFFSREETRKHVHVAHADGEAKFWLEPEISVATSVGFNSTKLAAALELVRSHLDEIEAAWNKHFKC